MHDDGPAAGRSASGASASRDGKDPEAAVGRRSRGRSGSRSAPRLPLRSERPTGRPSASSFSAEDRRRGPAPMDRIRLVPHPTTPLVGVFKRLLLAVGVVAAMVVIVMLDRSGYRDGADPTGEVSVIDAFYYATVSLSTTGYGDIIPVTDRSRALNAILITPLRVMFLLILIGTTLEALTERSRQELRVQRWRRHLHDHVVICGFGTKGRSAAKVITGPGGTPRDQVVVIDPDPATIDAANQQGYTGVLGDATRKEILRQAEVARAKSVIVAPNRDDAAVLTVLTLRQLAPDVRIAASVREAENVALVEQSGADSVITSSEASGRLLGLSTESPTLVTVVEDLLVTGQGLDIEERQARIDEVGRTPRDLDDVVLSVVRDNRLLHFDDRNCASLQPGDRLVVVKGHRGHGRPRFVPPPPGGQASAKVKQPTGSDASGERLFTTNEVDDQIRDGAASTADRGAGSARPTAGGGR